MAPQVAPDTLPADFDKWDSPKAASPPDTLPADFDKWDEKQQSAEKATAAPDPRQGWRDRFAASIADPSMTPDAKGTFKGELERFGQGAAQGLTQPFLHPLDTVKSMAEATPAGAVFDLATGRPNASQQQAQDLVNGAIANPSGTAGQVAGGVAEGGVLGAGSAAAEGVSRFPNRIRAIAAGDPNAAALKGLRVPSGSPKAQSTLSAVEKARPYLKGVESLEDLQNRIPEAKQEIWEPYQKAIDKYGFKKVDGPNGPTTLGELEQQRLEVSAQLRGLKARDPQAVQTALQKGQGEADLLAREKAIKAAMDPHLEKAGINPSEIRSRFSAVSRLGQKVAGKTTLGDTAQPSGLGKIGNISIKQPFKAPGEILSGARDLAAGRPRFRMNPTDQGIKEAFREAPPKPDLGSPDIPNVVQPEKHTFDGKSSVAASVPTEVTDLLHRTGAKITNNEAPTSKVVASVDPDEPNNINIDDKERYSKDKNAANQTLSHEAVHVWHNNLPPEIQKMIPMDDPKDPYHKNGYEPDELQNMRSQGLKLYNLPRERAATVIQKYSHLGGSDAPKEIRDVYEPWAKDLTETALSTVMPTSRSQEGINTDLRPPGAAPMPETKIFPEENPEEKKEKSDSVKEEKAEKAKHPAGDITGFDEETGLPIVKRKSAQSETKGAKPEPKAEKPEPKPAKAETPAPKAETEHKYKFGNTQANIPPGSDAHKAIKGMQDKIPDEHLHGDGKDIDEPHVTVRYGVQGDTSKLKDYLSKQAPFDAKLGKTTSFPPSEHSNGASPIVAPIESEDLHRMNGEIQKHADFAPSNFPDYKPHATVAYVHPDHADKYVGMKDGEGKTFKVGSVSISDRDGNKEDVKLGGSKDVPAPKSNPKGEGESEQAKPPAKSGGESFKVGDRVTLPDGTAATVAYVPSKNSQLPTYRFKVDGGKTRELRTSQMGRVKPAEEDGKAPPPGHTTVTTHFRRLPGK